MSKLPKGFPEYSIMYRTLKKQIKELQKEEVLNEKKADRHKSKIHQYEKELEKIKKMFPENYFDE